MSKKVKLGFIGTGIAASSLHWPAIKELLDIFEVTAVSGRNPEKAQTFAEMVGAGRVYTDYKELLKDSEVEAVLVSYTTGQNCEIAVAAIEAGKHVLVEKPIAPTIEQAKEMVLAARKGNVVTAVGENWYYWPILPAVREHMDKGTVGKPELMFTCSLGKMDLKDKHISQSTWRLGAKNGLIVDGGVHLTALLRQMYGPIAAGIGSTHKLREIWTENDTLSYQFMFENGIAGTYLRSAYAAGFPFGANMALFGTKGTMLFKDWFQELEIITEEGTVTESYKRTEAGFIPQFRNFYEAIQGIAKCNYDFEDGYIDLQAILGGTETGDKWEDLRFSPLP